MWKDLNMSEKSQIINTMVNNGIYNISDIRDIYDANDSIQYGEGGYKPSKSIRKRITDWEGESMKTNRSFEEEAIDFVNVLPKGAIEALTPTQLDALYSYSYNVGAGNFKKRVVPVLQRYLEGKATATAVAKSMTATKDSKLRGLALRRNVERNMFTGASDNRRVTMNNVEYMNSGFKPPVSFQKPFIEVPKAADPPVIVIDNQYSKPAEPIKEIPMVSPNYDYLNTYVSDNTPQTQQKIKDPYEELVDNMLKEFDANSGVQNNDSF